MIENIIYNKDSADNAVVVEDYPWGYKLRTKRKYWIETTKRGDRLCYQTLNPKTDKWSLLRKALTAVSWFFMKTRMDILKPLD